MKSTLTQAHASPDEFVLAVMGQPGYTAIPAGEVMHILQCSPRACRVRTTETCFSDLPFVCCSDELYLRAKTHVLTARGIPAECISILPILFQINGIWRQHLPKIVESRSPQILRPMTRLTWVYQDIANLINDEIYSPVDLERLHDHANLPIERPTVVEHVIRRHAGKDTSDNVI